MTMANARPYSVQWQELKELYNDILNEQNDELAMVDEKGSMVVFRKKSEKWTVISQKDNLVKLNISGNEQEQNTFLDLENV